MAVYTVLPAFYLAFVFCAIACTILSVQILSYAKKERRSYLTLDYLGVGVQQQKKLLKNHLFQLFFLPAIPAAFMNFLSFPMMTGSITKNASQAGRFKSYRYCQGSSKQLLQYAYS